MAHLKVPRRAVRILVLTVRSATQGGERHLQASGQIAPRTHLGGGVSVLDRSGVGFPIRQSLPGNVDGCLDTNQRFDRWFLRGVGRSLDRIKNGGGVGASCTIAVSRGDSHALLMRVGPPPSRDCHRADMNPIRREEETSVVSHQTGRVESSR